jgi:hypothetical protein
VSTDVTAHLLIPPRISPRQEGRPLGSPGRPTQGRTPPSVPYTPPQPAWNAEAARDDPSEGVEDRLARLASALGPLRRVLAGIAERLIGARAAERLGYARLGDYARERLGLSARQLQDLARVHRALCGLPAVERALVANELPWSKVRLLARVARAEDEAAWIARARAMPTHRLEQTVRASPPRLDPADLDEGVPETRVAVRCTPAVCEKWALAREIAERAAGERLRPGEVLELVAAEVYSAISIDPALAEIPDGPPAPRRRAGEEEARGSPGPCATRGRAAPTR